jgi:hypothetical protein
MKANLDKSEIVAKLEAAERKAQMAAQIEANCFLTLKIKYLVIYLAFQVAKAMEEMDARFSDKFVLREKSMEEKQQKEMVELKVPSKCANFKIN